MCALRDTHVDLLEYIVCLYYGSTFTIRGLFVYFQLHRLFMEYMCSTEIVIPAKHQPTALKQLTDPESKRLALSIGCLCSMGDDFCHTEEKSRR